MKSKPILKAPVPDKVCREQTLPSFRRGESLPKMSFWLPETNPGLPSMGIYS